MFSASLLDSVRGISVWLGTVSWTATSVSLWWRREQSQRLPPTTPRWYFDKLIIWVLSYFVTVLSFQITGRPPGRVLRQSLVGESLQLSHVIWRIISIAWHDVFPLATLRHCSKRVNCCRSGLVVTEGVGSLNLTTTALLSAKVLTAVYFTATSGFFYMV